MGPGPAVSPAGLSCRAPPKSRSASLYAAEPKWWFTDTGCYGRFISMEVIITRVVCKACRALGSHVQHLFFPFEKLSEP